jgi:hypothetical protein
MESDPVARQYLNELINESIKERKSSFPTDKFRTHYDHLCALKLTGKEWEKSFQLDYAALPVCFVLAEIAEEIMSAEIPSEPISALTFVYQFTELIREPNPRTFWYQDLAIRLETYVLLYLHENHQLDVTAFAESVTDDMMEETSCLRSMNSSFTKVFPFLRDDNVRQFQTIERLLTTPTKRYNILDAVNNLGEINPVKAAALYEYAKKHNGATYEGLFTHFYKSLYHFDGDHYLQEAMDLHDINKLECICALSGLNYDQDLHIRTAFEFMKDKNETDIDCMRILPTFYTRLIDNIHTPEDIRKECFTSIGQLTNTNDEQLKNSLIWRTSSLKGYDKEKMDLFPTFFSWGNPHFLTTYFDHFDSPASLFGFTREAFIEYGMTTNLNLFESALSTQQHVNIEKYNLELLQFLTDNLAIIRFAGIKILLRINGRSSSFSFLELNEKKQLRIIESLLPTPTNIEELLPLVLTLRNSPFPAVRSNLETGLIALIEAYGHHTIDMTKNCLDPEDPMDEELLNSLNAAFRKYKQEADERMQVKELDPIENELQHLELYFQLEHEKQAEMMEEATRQSIFAQLAKNIHVIRGSAFNTELNPEISLMGEVGASHLLDQRYSINPEAYEWNFRLNATTKNYSEEEDAV